MQVKDRNLSFHISMSYSAVVPATTPSISEIFAVNSFALSFIQHLKYYMH